MTKYKQKYYQCQICNAYRKFTVTWHDSELPDVCPNCYSEWTRLNNCKRHSGIAADNKTCGLCKIEAQMSDILPRMNRLFNKKLRQ